VVTLSSRLRDVELALECQLCGHSIVKKGVWFMTASTFKCHGCKGVLQLTYSDKVELFAKHAHLEEEKGVLVNGRWA
jgi:transposase-like protein